MNNALNGHLFSIVKARAWKQYKTNNNPWAIPMIWLGSGMSYKYFRGMETARIRMKETPSKKAVILNRPTGVRIMKYGW